MGEAAPSLPPGRAGCIALHCFGSGQRPQADRRRRRRRVARCCAWPLPGLLFVWAEGGAASTLATLGSSKGRWAQLEGRRPARGAEREGAGGRVAKCPCPKQRDSSRGRRRRQGIDKPCFNLDLHLLACYCCGERKGPVLVPARLGETRVLCRRRRSSRQRRRRRHCCVSSAPGSHRGRAAPSMVAKPASPFRQLLGRRDPLPQQYGLKKSPRASPFKWTRSFPPPPPNLHTSHSSSSSFCLF